MILVVNNSASASASAFTSTRNRRGARIELELRESWGQSRQGAGGESPGAGETVRGSGGRLHLAQTSSLTTGRDGPDEENECHGARYTQNARGHGKEMGAGREGKGRQGAE